MYIAELRRVRHVSPDGNIRTLIGVGPRWGEAEVSRPTAVAVTPAGDVYVADFYRSRVQKIAASGQVTTTVKDRDAPRSLATAADGTVFAAAQNVIVALAPDGVMRTVVGTGTYSGDAPRTGADAPK